MTKKCQACGKETDLVVALGPVLLCRTECHPEANIDREAAQSAGEAFDITLWARRRYNRLHDSTGAERIQRRNDQLRELSRQYGYDSMSTLLTDWLNGKINVVIVQN